jgi:hypothetical protein
MPEDETTVCEVCGRDFPGEVAWMEHFEDTHLQADEDDDE